MSNNNSHHSPSVKGGGGGADHHNHSSFPNQNFNNSNGFHGQPQSKHMNGGHHSKYVTKKFFEFLVSF